VRRPRGWPTLALALATVAVAILVWTLLRQGPDRTVSGAISTLEPHRVCVTDGTGTTCAEVGSPSRLAGFATGDCAALRTSADGILVSLERSPDGC
jgi:hypothetical protein